MLLLLFSFGTFAVADDTLRRLRKDESSDARKRPDATTDARKRPDERRT